MSLFRLVLLAILLGVSFASRADTSPQTVVHILDYVGVDYAGAVEGGKIKKADEYKEMVEFTGEAATLIKNLPAVSQRATLVAEAETLARMVRNKAAAADVAAAAG